VPVGLPDAAAAADLLDLPDEADASDDAEAAVPVTVQTDAVTNDNPAPPAPATDDPSGLLDAMRAVLGDETQVGDASSPVVASPVPGDELAPALAADLIADPAPADAIPVSIPGDGGLAPLIEDVDPELLRARIAAGVAGFGANPDGDDLPPPVDLEPRQVRAAVEAILLISLKPLTPARLATCLPGADTGYLDGILQGLAARYDHEGRGWELRRLAGGWQLLTRRELHPWVRQLDRKELPTQLSRSAMETLAIIAYKQPVSRGEIEDIRGVQAGPMVKQLMDMKLVRVVGRNDDAIGRPLLYGTSEGFLERFGLGSTADLPKQHEFG
jgi:segregation and condensation protein B